MRAFGLLTFLIPCGLVACAAPDVAADTVDDPARTLFRSFESEDPGLLATSLRLLEAELGALPLDGPVIGRTLAMDDLGEPDVADVERPAEHDPSDATGILVAGRSAFPPSDHAPLQLLEDQRPLEPSAPDDYTRTLLEGADCWVAEDCAFLRTDNALTRKNVLVEIPFTMRKDFRWVDLATEGESARWAILDRSWTPDGGLGASEVNELHQQFSVDAWIPLEDGGSLRFIVTWYEVATPALTDDAQRVTVQNGIDAIFRAADEMLAEGR